VVALTHSVSEWGDLHRRDAAHLDSAWVGGQQRWADLSSQGRVQIVDQAGHFIQNDQPQAVVDAVREVLSGG
jgi:pimeloyl-ACP methyl ester carboxylesterase